MCPPGHFTITLTHLLPTSLKPSLQFLSLGLTQPLQHFSDGRCPLLHSGLGSHLHHHLDGGLLLLHNNLGSGLQNLLGLLPTLQSGMVLHLLPPRYHHLHHGLGSALHFGGFSPHLHLLRRLYLHLFLLLSHTLGDLHFGFLWQWYLLGF